MRRARPDGVLSDLDGTLADTAPDPGVAANRMRSDIGLAPLPIAPLRPYASHGVRGMLGAALGWSPRDAEHGAQAVRLSACCAENLWARTRLFDQIDDVLATLDRAAIPWGIVTNKRKAYTNPLLSALERGGRACGVISGDNTPRPKPAPDPPLLACEVSGLAPRRCVFVGDDLRDIEAGRATGITTSAAA